MEELQNIQNQSVQARDLPTITAEIKQIQNQARSMALMYTVEIGRRLIEAKAAVPYGGWGDYIKNELNFSQSAANTYMKLFEEYGSQKISIFGAMVDSQTFANLPYSKALSLLSLPPEEREEMAEKAENMSTRELDAAIKERNAARKEAEEAKKRIAELEASKAEQDQADALAEKYRIQADEFKRKAESAQLAATEAEKKRDALADQLAKAKKNPKIAPEKLKEIQDAAEKAAKEAADKSNAEEIDKLKKAAEDAEAKRIIAEGQAKEATGKLAEAERKLKTASPELTQFKTLFTSMQETALKLDKLLDSISENDTETGDKLRLALKQFAQRYVR